MVILIVIAVVLLSSLVLFIQKVTLKRRLGEGLGRQVKDHEITSITAWMDASPKSEPTPTVPTTPVLEKKDSRV
jgi:hypothetical protein